VHDAAVLMAQGAACQECGIFLELRVVHHRLATACRAAGVAQLCRPSLAGLDGDEPLVQRLVLAGDGVSGLAPVDSSVALGGPWRLLLPVWAGREVQALQCGITWDRAPYSGLDQSDGWCGLVCHGSECDCTCHASCRGVALRLCCDTETANWHAANRWLRESRARRASYMAPVAHFFASLTHVGGCMLMPVSFLTSTSLS
jgi:hypothetical protein